LTAQLHASNAGRWLFSEAACALEDLTWPIEPVEVRDDDDAAARRFLGSPSIGSDGQELWPEPRKAYYMSCRTYRTPEGLRGWPTVEMLRERLRALRGEDEDAEGDRPSADVLLPVSADCLCSAAPRLSH